MPSFSTSTVVFFLFLVTTTTTTIGGNVRKIKHSKKTNANANTCLSRLLGKSQYTSCDGTETELDIACANKDNAAAAAAADSTLTERLLCSYSEHPVQYENEAAATPHCGVHGSFDPWTHITLDHATGVCRLKFVVLTDSCDAAAPVFTDGNFGVMVEAPLSTDPGSHNHEHNEDSPHNNNSGMLLWFSIDAGVTYYNTEDPRNTVPLNRSSPRRKLDSHEECKYGCKPPKGLWTTYPNGTKIFTPPTFHGYSKIKSLPGEYPISNSFETCYQYRNERKYCWSESRGAFCPGTGKINNHPCRPVASSGDDGILDSSAGEIRGWHALYNAYTFSCGDPCPEMCWDKSNKMCG